MIKRLNGYWRLFATGLSFTVFGLGGVLLWLIVFPLLNQLPGSPAEKIVRYKK